MGCLSIMTSRSATIAPLPPTSPKQQISMEKIDAAITETFQSIRHLHTLIKKNSVGDEIAIEALNSLLRASWTIENAQEGARQHVIDKNKYAYKNFLSKMKHININIQNLTQRCTPHNIIPFKLVAEAMLFGGDINAVMYQYK